MTVAKDNLKIKNNEKLAVQKENINAKSKIVKN